MRIAQSLRRIWSVEALEVRPLLFALGLCVGSVTYFAQIGEPPAWLILAWFAAALLGVLVMRRFWAAPVFYVLALVAFGAATGALAAKVRTSTVDVPIMTDAIGPVMVEGWVTQIEPARRGVRVRINVHSIANMDPAILPETIRLTHTARLEVSPGRFVRCWAVIRPAPSPAITGDYDFARQAYFQGLGGVGYVQGRCRGGVLGAPRGVMAKLQGRVSQIRRKLAVHTLGAAGDRAGGFAAALVSGDRSFMSSEDQEALRGSGLAHLLAISGLHMGIVAGLVYWLVRRGLGLFEYLALRIAVQKPAAAAAILASFAYLIMSGASVSTQRAFIMSTVFLGAILFDRSAMSLRSYAIAMIAVILLQPESVMSPGF